MATTLAQYFRSLKTHTYTPTITAKTVKTKRTTIGKQRLEAPFDPLIFEYVSVLKYFIENKGNVQATIETKILATNHNKNHFCSSSSSSWVVYKN